MQRVGFVSRFYHHNRMLSGDLVKLDPHIKRHSVEGPEIR